MTWDILPGREQEFFEFVVREFVPGMQRLGIQPTEAWYTTFGRRPQILTGGVTPDPQAMGATRASPPRVAGAARSAGGVRRQLRVEGHGGVGRISDVDGRLP